METQAPISRVGLAVAGPPIYTVLVEVVGWTLDRTAEIPKSQRFTFGQRLDNLALSHKDRAFTRVVGQGWGTGPDAPCDSASVFE